MATTVIDDRGKHYVILVHEEDRLYMKEVLEWAADHYLDNLKMKGGDYTRFDTIKKEIISKYSKQLEE